MFTIKLVHNRAIVNNLPTFSTTFKLSRAMTHLGDVPGPIDPLAHSRSDVHELAKRNVVPGDKTNRREDKGQERERERETERQRETEKNKTKKKKKKKKKKTKKKKKKRNDTEP